MFPSDGNNTQAEFHTFEQDVAIYGRQPDMVFDVSLADETAASQMAKTIKADTEQDWNLLGNNCATVTVDTLNTGGTNLPTNGANTPVQIDHLLGLGADAPKGMTAISVVRVSGRIDSQKLKEGDR